MIQEQARFWFVHAKAKNGDAVNLAVAAWTERSARIQARKRLPPHFAVVEANPVIYAHAWVLNHGWIPREVK